MNDMIRVVTMRSIDGYGYEVVTGSLAEAIGEAGTVPEDLYGAPQTFFE